MASIALAGVGAAAGPAGGVLSTVLGSIGGAVGGLVDNQFILPLLIKNPGNRARQGDIDISLAQEGTAASYVWGLYCRVPAHPVWVTRSWEETFEQRVNKRQSVQVSTHYCHALYHATANAAYFDQFILESKRVYTETPNRELTMTTRAGMVSATPGVWGFVRMVYTDPFGSNTLARVEVVLENVRDADGYPVVGSPDLSVLDIGGIVAIGINGVFWSGAPDNGPPLDDMSPDWWEVVDSRVIDGKGNSRLSARIIAPAQTAIPSAWNTTFIGGGGRWRIGEGLTVNAYGRLVRTDPKVFPLSADRAGYPNDYRSVIPSMGVKPLLLRQLLGEDSPELSRWPWNMVVACEKMSLSSFGNRLPSANAIVIPFHQTLEASVSDLLENYTRLAVDERSVVGVPVDEYLLGAVAFGPFRAEDVLTQVAIVHDLVWQEGVGADNLNPKFARFIKGSARDEGSLDTWLLNARESGSRFMSRDVEIKRIDDRERIKRIDVEFRDFNNSLQGGQTHVLFSAIDDARQVKLDLKDMTLAPEDAYLVAERVGSEAWDRQAMVRFRTPFVPVHLQSGDIVTIQDNGGETYRVLIDEIDLDPDTLLFEIRGFDVGDKDQLGLVSSYTEARGGVGPVYDTGRPAPVPGPLPIDAAVMDLPPLEDAHVGQVGFYVAVAPTSPGARMETCTVMIRREGGDWEFARHVEKAATMGRTLNALGSGDPEVYDTTNTLEVEMIRGELATATQQLVDAGSNLALVGTEILGFVNATLTGSDPTTTYDLTTLSRGRMATEDAVDVHAEAEAFVLLDDAVVFVPLDLEDLGTTIEVAVVPPAGLVDQARIVNHYVAGSTAVPPPPRNVQIVDVSGTLTVSWDYRSLHTLRFRNPRQNPVSPDHRMVVQLYNIASGVVPVGLEPTQAVDGLGTADALEITNPGSAGLVGPTITARVIVRSSLTGDSVPVEVSLEQTYEPLDPGFPEEDTLIGLADTPDGYGTPGQVLKVNGSRDGTIWSDVFQPVEHILTGSGTGSVGTIELVGPNGEPLDGDGGVPTADSLAALSAAVSMRHSESDSGSMTLTLHRIRDGGHEAVASYTFTFGS